MTFYTPAPGVAKSEKGAANGVATLDSNAKVSTNEVPGGGSLPTVSSSDNGKFLTVVNGVWAATTVPNANGGSY